MNITTDDKKPGRLTKPGLDDELRAVLHGSNFLDYDAPLFIAWQLNSACNLGCLHCCEEAGHSMPDELTRQEALDFCTQIAQLNIPYMAISGGEPLLCRHFFDVASFIRDHDISLKIETNGEFIDRATAERLARLKLRSIQISLDGATPQAHEQLRVRGNWQKAVGAIKLLVSLGVNAEIVFVPTRFNIHQIGDIIDIAYSLGVYGLYTGKTMRIGRAAQNWGILCPTEEEYQNFFTVLKKKQAQYDGRMKVYYYPYDVIEELKYRLQYPSASLLVIPNGKVKIIGPLPFVCGDLRKHSLDVIWQRYKRAWQDPEVKDFANRVIQQPELLKEANSWKELYSDS